jgi:two-component system cell cycle response regulator CpdR
MARILLADDDAASRDLVSRALGSDGHSVVMTQDGSEALDSLNAAPGVYDLLITDVQMPVLDGVTLAEKALTRQPGLRVILMSGYTSELDRAKPLEAKGLSVISKPFTLEQIRASVKRALAGR